MLPWGEMWRAALRAGVDPTLFWQLSLVEWRWLAGTSDKSLLSADLAKLMEMFPDG